MLDESFVSLGMSGLFCPFYSIFYGNSLLANNVDPDQSPYRTLGDSQVTAVGSSAYMGL